MAIDVNLEGIQFGVFDPTNPELFPDKRIKQMAHVALAAFGHSNDKLAEDLRRTPDELACFLDLFDDEGEYSYDHFIDAQRDPQTLVDRGGFERASGFGDRTRRLQ